MDTNIVFLSLQLLLPIFNEFAEKAGTDLKLPLTEERITKQKIGKSQYSGSMVIFDDRYQFSWESDSNYWGRIGLFADKEFASNYIRSGKPGEEEKMESLTKQKALINETEALGIAIGVLHRLGFNESKQGLKPPKVVQFHYGFDKKGFERWLPLFSVTWYSKRPPKGVESYAFQIEVSGLTKKVVRFNQLWVNNTYMDLRPLIKKLPKPLPLATNEVRGIVLPINSLLRR